MRDNVIETIEQLEPFLQNWSSYFKDRVRQRVTFSLEGRYKSEEIYDEKSPSAPVNAKDAINIERNVIQLPFKYKLTLAVEYMYRTQLNNNKFYRFCRIAVIKPRDYDDLVKTSKRMLINRLNKESR